MGIFTPISIGGGSLCSGSYPFFFSIIMSKKDAQISKARELQQTIERMNQEEEQIARANNELEAERSTNASEIQQLQYRQQQIEGDISRNHQRRVQIQRELSARESEYMKLLE